MRSDTPTITQRRQLDDADFFSRISELATNVHEGLGYALATEVALTKNAKWTELGTHAVASALDWVDGFAKDLAVRSASKALFKGVKLNNRDTKPNSEQWAILHHYGIYDNPRGDEQTDKRYYYSLTGALVVRMARNHDARSAEQIATNIAVSKIRDDTKSELRDYAEQHGWSTNAKALGKLKTFLHGLGIAALLTPTLDNKAGHMIGTNLISTGTVVGLLDLQKYRSYIHKQEQKL
ncbi:hypothetical protein EB118_02375 [bacterium]|jgi:phosphatidylglycerophosphate synthase|nr:hypothetical protein [bacterium]NBX98456.1 hypothetical protein [bacterium]NDC94102.1 hypothetical protein [bacterium]NDD83357.1 hypothetical protein [bacterium]NDG28935.1 hypothetical protein [bacterium]